MTDKSPPDRNVAYTVRMTADESAALERIRIAMGARSHAEVVRRLIAGFGSPSFVPVQTDARVLAVAADGTGAIMENGSVVILRSGSPEHTAVLESAASRVGKTPAELLLDAERRVGSFLERTATERVVPYGLSYAVVDVASASKDEEDKFLGDTPKEDQ